MKASRTAGSTQEPIGIVISPGSPQDTAPARFAYVWAPPPATDIAEELPDR